MSSSAFELRDDGLLAFLRVRSRLFGIAQRMLGCTAEAEDIVQDVWVRWQMADRRLVRDATAFLTTTAKRLAINVLQSARSRRETYVGPGLPEPADGGADPRIQAERSEALASGVQLLIERLTRAERAAYILREAFDYPYRDIAYVLRLEEANARQVVTRARQRVANGRGTPVTGHRLVRPFVLRTSWRNINEEHSSVGTLPVACGRHTRGSEGLGPITLVEGSGRGAGQRALNDHSRLLAWRIESSAYA
jgi:RNA polymerase sigma factor (sigma-70 family)